MIMTSEIHTTMHHDHRDWEVEIGLWRDDIRAWQHEVSSAVTDLKEIESLLDSHAASLRTHAAALQLMGLESGAHEHAIVEFEKGATGEELLPLAKKHLTENAHQAQQRDAHERIKHYHRTLIAKVNQLIKTARNSM